MEEEEEEATDSRHAVRPFLFLHVCSKSGVTGSDPCNEGGVRWSGAVQRASKVCPLVDKPQHRSPALGI